MPKAQARIADSVAAMARTYRPRRNGFLDALSPEHRAEMLDMKRQFLAAPHTYGGTATVAAKLIYAACQQVGIRTCGPEGLREWLTRPLEGE